MILNNKGSSFSEMSIDNSSLKLLIKNEEKFKIDHHEQHRQQQQQQQQQQSIRTEFDNHYHEQKNVNCQMIHNDYHCHQHHYHQHEKQLIYFDNNNNNKQNHHLNFHNHHQCDDKKFIKKRDNTSLESMMMIINNDNNKKFSSISTTINATKLIFKQQQRQRQQQQQQWHINKIIWNLIIFICLWLTLANTICYCDKLINRQNPLPLSLPMKISSSSSLSSSTSSSDNNLVYHHNHNQYRHRQYRQHNPLPSSSSSSSSYPSARSMAMMVGSPMVIATNGGIITPSGQLSSASSPSAAAVAYQALPIMHHMFHQHHYGHNNNKPSSNSPSSSSSSVIIHRAAIGHHKHHYPSIHHHQQQEDCEMNADAVLELLFEKMRIHLPEEKITVQNGAITIFDARITHFAELARLRQSCARKLDPDGVNLLLPFEAEIRSAHVAAKLKYNFYVTDIYGDYAANFSHIRLNGTFETNLEDEWMQVSEFNITSSQVIDDSIQFGYVPRWILDWVRSYFDNDNTRMYEQLAKVILQKEADNFENYDLLRHISERSSLSMSIEPREEDDDQVLPPLNLL
ncbi:uncharacterized protein LOC124490136 [Dermatophagoides farinae]|uniref:uncharacterized protein LOC124490136 n=1 Tax=Dermatophagoides farinae TaxID=6954 RepID=UPI003F6094A4